MTCAIDLSGMRFGRLVAVERIGKRWRCKCDCGREVTPLRCNLRAGRSQSCGCAGAEASRKSILRNRKPVVPIAERFWSKVAKGEGCWEWQASLNTHGYGQFTTQKGCEARQAYRVAYELTFGPIPNGGHILHQCDNKLCVRPDHLRLGNHAENMREAGERGRMRRGELAPGAKLTADDVRQIRASGKSRDELGAEFGVNPRYISEIVSGRAWRHV